MRLLLLLLALVLGVCSVIVQPEDYTSDAEVDLTGNEEGQQPVERTFFLLNLLKQKFQKLQQLKQGSIPIVNCICVPFYLCATNGTVIIDGSGVIDFRQIRQCANAAEICCVLRQIIPTLPTTLLPTTQPTRPTTRPIAISTLPTTQPTTRTTLVPTTRPTIIPTLPTTQPTTRATAVPTTRPTIASTVPTTRPTTPMTLLPMTNPVSSPRSTIFPNQFCICVPIFQCALNSGFVVTAAPGNINPRQQLISNCNGIFVCCSNAGPQTTAATTAAFTLPTTPPTTRPPPTLPTTLPIVPTTRLPTTMLPAFNLQQNCLCVLLAACGLGFIPWSNVGNIDPRMLVPRQGASCSPNSVCCQLGPTAAAAAAQQQSATQISSLALKFGNEDIKNAGSPNACRCVPVDDCPESDTVSYDVDGTIDPRLGPCMSPVLVCCKLASDNVPKSGVAIVDVNPSALVVTDTIGRENVASCGLRDTTYSSVTSPLAGTAYFAEFPWMALILVRRVGSNDVVQCGGSLINSRVVLTAAHCVVSCDPGTLIARLGEWDTSSTTEPLPYQEFGVQNVIVHPQYYPNALYHDVALLVLNRAVTYTVNIRPICLAAQGLTIASGTVCFASGWGVSAFGEQGQYQSVLRRVALPIVDNVNCETRLRATRLGQFFQLHSSFICAGGQANMDTCTKDGGGPLSCLDQTGRFTQVGIVSWGIGCGSSAPGVYASVAQDRQWIDQQVSILGVYT